MFIGNNTREATVEDTVTTTTARQRTMAFHLSQPISKQFASGESSAPVAVAIVASKVRRLVIPDR